MSGGGAEVTWHCRTRLKAQGRNWQVVFLQGSVSVAGTTGGVWWVTLAHLLQIPYLLSILSLFGLHSKRLAKT